MRVACSAGINPKNAVEITAPAIRNSATRQSAGGAAMLMLPISGGMLGSSAASVPSIAMRDTRKPTAAAASASNRLSVSNCRTMRRRDAPSDRRMPISRCRDMPRASSRFATFAHPIIRMSPNEKNSGENTTSASSGCGTVPRLGTAGSWLARSSAVAPADCAPMHRAARARLPRSCRASAARRCRGRRESSRPRWIGRNSASDDSGAQRSGAPTLNPRKPAGITPTTSCGAPLTMSVRPSTPGSRRSGAPTAIAQHHHRLRRGSVVVGGQQRAAHRGRTPITWNALPLTSVIDIMRPVDARIDVGQLREHAREHAGLARHGFELRSREARPLVVGIARALDGEHLVDVAARCRCGTGRC